MNERTTEQAMREAFETWAFNEGLDIGRSYMQLPTRCYISLNTNSAWRAWQAAQATPQPQTVRSALKILDRALIEPLSVAPGGQESEAQAVGFRITSKNGAVSLTLREPDSYELRECKIEPVFLSPPSALAIETAALRKAVALVSGNYGWKYGGGSGEYCDDFGDAVLALIPQDGITALEEFGMKVAREAMRVGRTTYFSSSELAADDCLRAIVTSLIGEKK